MTEGEHREQSNVADLPMVMDERAPRVSIRISISGHTDGADQDNRHLRAAAIRARPASVLMWATSSHPRAADGLRVSAAADDDMDLAWLIRLS